LKQVKRGGGAHHPKPFVFVPDGAFAIECPACPHPGKNLPVGWEQAPHDSKYFLLPSCGWRQLTIPYRWLYSLFLAVDANFRLKLKDRKIQDPEIGSGWAYFVETNRYLEHISQSTDDLEVSELSHNGSGHQHLFKVTGCGSNFHAVNQVNRKSTKDYVASGVVACVCARHSLMMKNGVGDLQRGERYVCSRYLA
jgi:hypothetical protein